MSEESFIQLDVENKQEENKKLNENENENDNDNDNDNENENVNENDNDNDNDNKNNKFENKIVKDSNIKELIEKTKEIKRPNWIDKNKLKDILTIIDSNKFGHKNKISEFKYTDIKDLDKNIKSNTICKLDAKKRLNTLNIIKKSEIKHRRLMPGQKELLNLLDDLSNIILTYKTLKSEIQENKNKDNESENENENKTENENENEDENENKDDYYDYENQNKTIDHDKIIFKKWYFRWNNWQIKIIWRANKIVKKKRRFKRILAL